MKPKTTIALAAVTGLLGAGTAAAVLPSWSQAEGLRSITVARTAETVHHHRGRHHHHARHRDDRHDAGDDHGGHG